MQDRRQFLDALKDEHDLRVEFPFDQTDRGGRLVRPRSTNGGKGMLGLCPFHARSSGTPSLVATRTHFRCYGGCVGEWWEHGDIFTVLMKLEGLNFLEAVERLAGERSYKLVMTQRVAAPVVPVMPEPPILPLQNQTMEKYFLPLDAKNAESLLKMGFTMETLQWAGVKMLWTDVFAFPIYVGGALMNVKLYDPLKRGPKWRAFFTNRHKQLYLSDDAIATDLGYAVLYESEKDALLSRQWGFPSIATGGAGVWQPEFSAAMLSFDTVLGVKDLDAAGEGWAAKVRRDMPGRFKDVDWRLLDPGFPEGFDLGKFILHGGTRAQFESLLHASQEDSGFLYEGI